MHVSNVILGYFGPETVLPMTSLIASVAGLFMIMGRHSTRLLFRCFRVFRFRKRGTASSRNVRPHVPHAAADSGHPRRSAAPGRAAESEYALHGDDGTRM